MTPALDCMIPVLCAVLYNRLGLAGLIDHVGAEAVGLLVVALTLAHHPPLQRVFPTMAVQWSPQSTALFPLLQSLVMISIEV